MLAAYIDIYPWKCLILINSYYLSNLIELLSFENKKIVLLGDFNVGLLNHDSNHFSNFLDIMHSNRFFLILQVQLEILINQVL